MTGLESSVFCEDDDGEGCDRDLKNLGSIPKPEEQSADFFNCLPPEMVTLIFEHLEKSAPLSMLSCRMTCHRFKYLIDDLLEKQQMSPWNWSKYYGEAKPFIHPGPLRRHLPVDKIFSKTAEITNFLNDMKGHLDHHGNINPFPNRGIYLRRVKSNPPPTESSDPDNPPEADIDLHKPSFLKGLGLNDNPEENEAYLLSLSKINLLLTPFGNHLTSLIFECGVTADLKSLEDLRDILEKVRNLQYLMLKGVRIQQKAPVEHLPFPKLPNLKSVKVIRCRGILESLIYAYHNQLETFQVVNSRDNYFPSLKKLLQQQQSDEGDSDKRGLIFGKLRELKFGELERCKEFDNFVEFIKGDADEEVNIFPKLDHLSIMYSMYGNFCDKPVEKLFEPLEHLPRLKEFNVGICGSTGFNFGEDEKCGRFNFGGGGGSGKLVRRLSVPVQLIMYPSLVARLVGGMSGLEIVRFLRNNEDGTREEFSKEMETVVDGMLRDFPGLRKVEIVDINGDQENIICGAVAV